MMYAALLPTLCSWFNTNRHTSMFNYSETKYHSAVSFKNRPLSNVTISNQSTLFKNELFFNNIELIGAIWSHTIIIEKYYNIRKNTKISEKNI